MTSSSTHRAALALFAFLAFSANAIAATQSAMQNKDCTQNSAQHNHDSATRFANEMMVTSR